MRSAPPEYLLSPKSIIFSAASGPLDVKRKFSGLRSRWTTGGSRP